MKRVRISELEEIIGPKIKIMSQFENRVDVSDIDSGKDFSYIGRAYDFVYYNEQLRGIASIEKKEIENGLERSSWRIKTNEMISGFPLFVSFYNGKKISSENYRHEIKMEAKNINLILRNELLSMVFDPIDKELMELYDKVRKSDFDNIEIKFITD